MRIIRRVLEYVWYPVFLTVCFWVSVQLGAFDTFNGIAAAGFILAGYIVWKICGVIRTAPFQWQQIYLALAFCWCIAGLAECGFDPTPRSRQQVEREAWNACLPLALGIKFVQISRDFQRG